MNGILDKFKSMMLGTEYDDDDYDNNEYDDRREYDSRDDEDEAPTRGSARVSDIDHINTKKAAKNGNVLTFRNPGTQTEMQVVITRPNDVPDATLICDHVKENKACVVNLEGVQRDKAQRIADFLGGAAFALNGEIERISNEIFIIAPSSVHIAGDLKEELKAGSHMFSWASSFK